MSNFLRRAVLALEMVSLLYLVLPAKVVSADLPYPDGRSSLKKDAALSAPFTVLDQLLLELERELEKATGHTEPIDGDYQWSRQDTPPLGVVKYREENQRIELQISVDIKRIADPWQEVCTTHLRDVADRLLLPRATSGRTSKRLFFSQLLGSRLGERASSDYDTFLNALVVSFGFIDLPHGTTRWCFLDNNSGQISFFQHPK